MTLMNKIMIMTAVVMAASANFVDAAFTAMPKSLQGKPNYKLEGQVIKKYKGDKVVKTISEQDGIWTHQNHLGKTVKVSEILANDKNQMVIERKGGKGDKYTVKQVLDEQGKVPFEVPKNSYLFGAIKTKTSLTKDGWRQVLDHSSSLKSIQLLANENQEAAALIFQMNGVPKSKARNMAWVLKSNKTWLQKNQGLIMGLSIATGLSIPFIVFYVWAKNQMNEYEMESNQISNNYKSYESRMGTSPARIPTPVQ